MRQLKIDLAALVATLFFSTAVHSDATGFSGGEYQFQILAEFGSVILSDGFEEQPLIPGDSCEDPLMLELELLDAGSTDNGVTNKYTPAGCSDQGSSMSNAGDGYDSVYQFTAPQMGVYRITLTPSTKDMLLYAFDDASCGKAACVGWINEGGAGTKETLDVHLVASQVAYIVADAASGDADSFTIEVQELITCADDLLISEYAEGIGMHQALEIFNGTGSDINLGDYKLLGNVSGGSWGESSYNFANTTLAHGDVYLVCREGDDLSGGSCDVVLDSSIETIISMNGDDARALAYSSGDVLIDAIGNDGGDPGAGWAVAGTLDATKDHALVRKASVMSPTVNWSESAGTNIDDSQWEVHPSDYYDDLGIHDWDGACGLGSVETPTATVDPPNKDTHFSAHRCTEGWAATGIVGQSGAFIEQFSATCQPVFLWDDSVGEVSETLGSIGASSGGADFGPFKCPANEVLVGLNVGYENAIVSLQGRCLSIDAVDGRTDASTHAGSTSEATGSTVPITDETMFCQNGAVVTGIEGFVDSIGLPSSITLICRSIP